MSALFDFRKLPVNVVGKPRRILRRSPPQHVSRDERERLVNMATKLIVATVRFQITVWWLLIYKTTITTIKAVTKISSCQANATSMWGIKQPGFFLVVFFFCVPLKVAGSEVHSSRDANLWRPKIGSLSFFTPPPRISTNPLPPQKKLTQPPMGMT